ncbi:MAG: penicillin-binding protein 2 [Sphaerospermopsis sp. SIO1G2]|nr:penicillin-binding protein 2 [Sphaerospermopsis sp. SIO1G2]
MNRRAFLLGGVQLAVSSLLIGRLYQLQAVKSDTYRMMAEDNRINLQLIVPERGLILDRVGKPLASNHVNYRLMMERSAIKKKHDLFPLLAPLLDDPDFPLEQELQRQLRRTPHEQNIMLKEYLTWEEISAVEFNAPRLPGISVEAGTVRHYPLGHYASHLVGYVGTPSRDEAKGNRLLRMPGVKIGKNGLEKREEVALQGKPGLRHMEVNALGQYLKEIDRKDSVNGQDMHCTISGELQAYAAQRLGEESGAVVVLDIETGDILTLCSVPAFDPNRFSRGISHRYWNELMNNEKTPLLNKAITGQYPPGSTYKMIVGLQALEKGLITPETTFFCPGHFELGNHRFNCWKASGHGHMNLRRAITQSCDTYFYHLAVALGMSDIAEMSREFGLGITYDLGIMGEKRGLIPTADWKYASYNQLWQTGDTVNASIGQGYVLTTPLQLAVMTARLASGKKVMPRLSVSPDTPIFEEVSVSKSSLGLMQMAMYDVMTDDYGTARASHIRQLGYEMAGKTGTSQVRRITIRGQDQSLLPWKQRHHGLFVAFAPYHKPRYACAVVVEHGGSGSSVAAPVAKDVMIKAQQIMGKGA